MIHVKSVYKEQMYGGLVDEMLHCELISIIWHLVAPNGSSTRVLTFHFNLARVQMQAAWVKDIFVGYNRQLASVKHESIH